MLHLTSTCPAMTEALARDLARVLKPGSVILLRGDLGMGKTLFSRAFIREMAGQADLNVTSPTFNLAATYETAQGPVWHFDLYRMKHANELEEVGFFAALGGRAVLVEWPEQLDEVQAMLPVEKCVTITFKGDADMTEKRVIEIDAGRQLPKPRTAFVFAAGLGNRMRPLTDTMPKPLVPVAGRPILAYVFDMLAAAGVERLILNTYYHAEQIAAFVDGYRDQFDIQISHETELLETGGGLKKALSMIQDDVFYAINGDSLLLDGPGLPALTQLAARFDPAVMDMLLLLQAADSHMITPAVGDYRMAADGRLTRATDKHGDYMFTGARILSSRVLDSRPVAKYSFLECMDASQAQGRLFGLPHVGEWHHLTTPQDVAVVDDYLRQSECQVKVG